jgi:hypothetical protein
MLLRHSPAREMSQPWEKLDPMSTHINCVKETLGEVVNGPDDMISFGHKCRVAINDRQSHGCRSTTKMSIPLRGFSEQVTSLEHSLRRLRLVKPSHRACTKFLIGGLAHSTPTRELKKFIPFVERFNQSTRKEEALTYHRIGKIQRRDRQS